MTSIHDAIGGGDENTASSEDDAIARELLSAGVSLSRVVELLDGRLDERKISNIARSIFSIPPAEPPTRGVSLTDLGNSILNRSKSACNDPNFVDGYISRLTRDIPEDFIDPIFLTLMNDPVIMSSGFICDRKTIIDEKTGIMKFSKCPWTREELHPRVYPVVPLRKKIVTFKEKKIRPMLDAASKLVENNKLEEFLKVQNSAKDFLFNLGEATYTHYEKEIAELNFDAWNKAGDASKNLWTPKMLAENFVSLYKGTPELLNNASKDLSSSSMSKEHVDFVGRISILEQQARGAISINQLDDASKWCDACDLVNKSCNPIANLPVNQIRLEIGKKRGEDLEYLKMRAYYEIQKDPEAVIKFFESENINKIELEKIISNTPVAISGRVGWFVDKVTLHYSDGSEESYGGDGGDKLLIKLDVGEIIVMVEGFQLDNPEYLGTYLKFTTNLNREFLLNGNGSPYSQRVDPQFSLPDGETVHKVEDPAGYYYRFTKKTGIFGLHVNMVDEAKGKIEGIVDTEECLAKERLYNGEYNIINVNKGTFFCSDNAFCDGDIWPFIAPNRDYANGGQERWHIRRRKNGKYTIRNGKHNGLFFSSEGTRYGPTEADNDGNHFTWVRPSSTHENYNNDEKMWDAAGQKDEQLWNIVAQNDGTYKLFNLKWNGPLYCSDRITTDGHHYLKTHINPDFEDESKERWELKLIACEPAVPPEDIFATIDTSTDLIDVLSSDSSDDDY